MTTAAVSSRMPRSPTSLRCLDVAPMPSYHPLGDSPARHRSLRTRRSRHGLKLLPHSAAARRHTTSATMVCNHPRLRPHARPQQSRAYPPSSALHCLPPAPTPPLRSRINLQMIYTCGFIVVKLNLHTLDMKDCSNKGSTRTKFFVHFLFSTVFSGHRGFLAGKNKLIFMIFHTIKNKLFSMAGAKNETYHFSLIFQ
jgi:hypothetical protein